MRAFRLSEICRNVKELQVKVHLNICHRNSDRVTAGLQLHLLEEVRCRIIFAVHTMSMILITSKVKN